MTAENGRGRVAQRLAAGIWTGRLPRLLAKGLPHARIDEITCAPGGKNHGKCTLAPSDASFRGPIRGRTKEGTLIETTGRNFEQEITEITETDNGNSVASVCSCSIVFPSSQYRGQVTGLASNRAGAAEGIGR